MRPTTSAARARRADDSYDHLEPRLARLAALEPGTAEHRDLRTEIITAALPLAEHIAVRFAGRGEPVEDLNQVAVLGLVQAVDRFDPVRGSEFLAFAVPTVMGEVRRHFRDRAWGVRVPDPVKALQQRLGPAVELLTQRLRRTPAASEIAAELDVEPVEVTRALLAHNGYRSESLDELPDGLDATATDPGYRLLEDALAVGPLLRALPERDRTVLRWRFADNCTQAEIAQRLGVSPMQVSRTLARILDGLRTRVLAERTRAA